MKMQSLLPTYSVGTLFILFTVCLEIKLSHVISKDRLQCIRRDAISLVRYGAVNMNARVRTASRCRRAYISPLWFFFLFFTTPNLWGHWTDLNQTWTHIHFGHIHFDLFEKFGLNSPRHLPPMGWGQNPLFWEWLNEHVSTTEHNINSRKETCQSTGTMSIYMPPNWVNFGPEWSSLLL